MFDYNYEDNADSIDDTKQVNPPFELVYAVVIGNDRRIYDKLSTARARVTSCVDQHLERFRKGVELWSVGASGWTLEFSASAGDHYSKIGWNTVIETNRRLRVQRAQEHRDREEANDRAAYERLKARFEG